MISFHWLPVLSRFGHLTTPLTSIQSQLCQPTKIFGPCSLLFLVPEIRRDPFNFKFTWQAYILLLRVFVTGPFPHSALALSCSRGRFLFSFLNNISIFRNIDRLTMLSWTFSQTRNLGSSTFKLLQPKIHKLKDLFHLWRRRFVVPFAVLFPLCIEACYILHKLSFHKICLSWLGKKKKNTVHTSVLPFKTNYSRMPNALVFVTSKWRPVYIY